MQRIELRLDVSAAVPLAGRHEVAMTAYLPPADALGPRPVAIFASPGGGYTRHYYDMQPGGHEGYSEAQAHVRQGFIFISYGTPDGGPRRQRPIGPARGLRSWSSVGGVQPVGGQPLRS